MSRVDIGYFSDGSNPCVFSVNSKLTRYPDMLRGRLSTLSPYTVSAQRISSNIGPEENSISAIRHYMASAHLSDRLFGEFMESVPDDVTVIVTSDHGMHMTDVHPELNKTTL